MNNVVNQSLISRNYGQNSATRTYQDIINKSTIETIVGLKTHEQAVFDNVNKWVKAGMKTNLVDKAGHNWSLEGYTRMVINTAAHNTYNKTRMNVMDKYDVTLAMMSSHAASRPACAPIQGLVVNTIPSSDPRYNPKYDSIYNHGYGEAGGTQGINCHHELFPYIEGVSTNPFTHPDTDEAIEKGKIQQKQRALERRIKNDKKQLNAAKKIGTADDISKLKAKHNHHSSEIKKLIKDNEFLKQNYSRERIQPVKPELTHDEKGAILKYVSSDSYKINDALRRGTKLSDEQQKTINDLNSALNKLPKYKSDKPLYRSYFFDRESLGEFVSDKSIGDVYTEKGFSSTSKSVYDDNDDLRIIIRKYSNAVDLKGYNDNEKEVLFKNGTSFKILKQYIQNGLPIMEVEEFEKEK
ncbi:phage minor capsid protein [Companilactobacillus keshanensis]|uniref:Phage minor capsid protein n=1 Tax=Companilactobacillus keshanensis TaxID=2486003 RepID=A0ABW4BVB2_9LACO|nr:phage minor capsid protein [Companilactobacillus keshanensis]